MTDPDLPDVPQDLAQLEDLTRFYFSYGEVESALSLLELWQSLETLSDENLALLAECYAMLDQEEKLSALIEQNGIPETSAPFVRLQAIVTYLSGNFSEAVSLFKKYLRRGVVE